jgi:HD-like signal output (HDOD) protein
MANDYIMERLGKIDMLPTFPRIAGEMMGILKDPASSASDLAKHMDPSMVGEVLRIANTAFSGTKNFRNIASLEHAIAVIGFDHVSEVVLHMPFISMTDGDGGTFDRNRYITHSILCAVLAKGISSTIHAGNPNQLYISGIMHDVGAIIIYRHFRDEWEAIDRLMTASGISRIEAERSVLSVDHGYIGADLLELWNTPGVITDAVRFHHQPDLATKNRDNVRTIHFANRLAKTIDLKEDLESFDEFSAKHRISIESAVAAAKDFQPSEEVTFLENIFDLLKEAKSYLGAVTKDNHDKSSCS